MWGGMFSGVRTLATWDNDPGGSIVDRYTDSNGDEILVVEFKRTPGVRYYYYAE
jgi:hypothetical protein